MKINKNTAFIAALSLVVTIGIFALFVQVPVKPVGASVRVGDQYQSTTTPSVAARTNLCPARIGMASSTVGILGSVNVLKTGAGTLAFYDATTTNATLRASSMSTSSLILADFSAGPTVGSYHFDIEFKNGLLVDYTTTGTGVASTTISYRCEG